MSIDKEVAIDCKIPMLAIGKCEVAGVEYAPGEPFTVASEHSRQYLISQRAAIDNTPDIAKSGSPASATESQVETTPSDTSKADHGKPKSAGRARRTRSNS